MEFGSADLRERGLRYADARGLSLHLDEHFRVGSGQEGSVWATTPNTAVKVLQ